MGWLSATAANAESVTVPFGLQVALFTKVADYDRTLPGRAIGVVRVVVLTRAGSPESAAAAGQVLDALAGIPQISGLPHEDSMLEFANPAAVAELCRARSISIVYLTPGLAEIAEALGKALTGIPVLTVSASGDGARKGAVLGFDLVASKPKLVVQLPSCRNQGVRLSSDVLKIATVIE
jgi:hypothetical protein